MKQIRNNGASVRNNAKMSPMRQNSTPKSAARIRAYQNWIMERPAEYWDETLEKRAANALRFSKDCKRTSALIIAAVQRPSIDAMLENMVFTLVDMQCDLDGLDHKWEFAMVADATAALLAQLKRLGGQKSAWAHKQNPAAIARKVFRAYETVTIKG